MIRHPPGASNEDTKPRLLALKPLSPLPLRAELLDGLEIDQRGGDGLVIGGVEIVVEIRAEGGVPRHRPAHLLFEGFNGAIRRAGNHHQRRVAGVQVLKVRRHIISEVGAPDAALGVLGTEHEVVHNELLAAFEEVFEADFAVRAFEGVVLVDFDVGELAAEGGDFVVGFGEGFFFEEEGFAG